MLLCCAMLASTAFGTEMKQVRVGDVIISTDDTNAAIKPLSRAGGKVFLNTSATATSSKSFSFSGNCKPEDGSHLSIIIDNTGDTDFNVRFSLTSNGESYTKTDLVTPEDPVYTQPAWSATDDGLHCSFSIQITPRRSDETAHFDIYIAQS